MPSRDIDFRLLLNQVWRDRLLIIVIIIASAILSVLVALNLQNLYRSDIKLYPNDASASELSSMTGQLGGLASLAGVELGNGGDKSKLAIQTLKSRDFISKFVNKYELKATLIAEKSWDANSNTLFFDSELYDSSNDVWVREVSLPLRTVPSDQEVYREFIEQHLIIQEDGETGIWTVTIEHISPFVAQKIAADLVTEINAKIRESDINEAESSLVLLKEALATIELIDMKSMLFELIQQNVQKKILAEVREEYVFKVIDPAVVPERKYSPSRAFLCVLGTFLGFLVGVFISVTRCILKGEV